LLSIYDFTNLDDPSGLASSGLGYTNAVSINASGQVAGYYLDSNNIEHGFIYSNGNYTDVTDPSAARYTVAQAINASGQVVGVYLDSNSIYHGFIYYNGSYTNLTDPSVSATGFT
jgi:probable HAF family extracellular repeat protein